jgi:phytanoyl-CoA hydroxylase
VILRTTALDDGCLPDDAVAAFRRDGAVIVERFVAAEACERLRARALELVEAFTPPARATVFSTHDQRHARDRYFEESAGRIGCFFEEEAFGPDGGLRQPKGLSINKLGHAMHDLDPVFDAFSHGPRLAAVARSVGLADPAVVQSMYIFKQPGIGGEVTCHQDSTYLYTRPMSVVGLWFAIEDAHRDNGCLAGLPGEHRKGLRSLFHRGPDGALRTDPVDPSIAWDESRAELLEVERGTLIVFDGCFPHRSAANRSPRSRHAYTLHAVDRACEYPADNWLQRDPSMPFRGFEPA